MSEWNDSLIEAAQFFYFEHRKKLVLKEKDGYLIASHLINCTPEELEIIDESRTI